MKKSLFAIAAVTAFAGAAQAQSSVTVYGLLDVGYVGGNDRLANVPNTLNPQASRVAGTPAGAVQKGNLNSFSSSAESTSRIGFKGNEDLGGGLSAFFTVELGLTPDGQQAVNSGTTQNRQTFVGLKKNGIGSGSIGTQYTIVQQQVAATDPGNTNNIAGNLIYPAATGSNGSQSNSTGAAYTVRTNNQLQLNSDSFAGFKVNAMAVMNNKNTTEFAGTGPAGTTTVTGGLNNQNGWGLGANYTWNKLYVTANYQAFSSKQDGVTITNATGTAVPTLPGAPTVGYVSGASTPGVNVKDNQWYAAATYDFGILKAYAQYINRKVTSQLNDGYYLKRTAQQIGVRSYITPAVEVWASGGLGRYTGFGANTANLTAWQLGSNYWLSKRTNLYAIYGMAGTSNTSFPTTANPNPNPSSSNISNYAIGVRHTF
jgi:predicted porin